MAITTMDGLVTAMAASTAQFIPFNKQTLSPDAVGAFHSCWLNGGNAGSTAPAYNAGSGYTCSKSTAGALPLTNGATQLYLSRMDVQSAVAGNLILYDRLWACSGITIATSTLSVTTPGDLPARAPTNGVGCEIWVEVPTATGAVAGNITVNYSDQDGNASSTSTVAVVASLNVGTFIQMPLASGDTGVRSITSLQTSFTTTGTLGVVIMNRIAICPYAAYIGGSRTWDSLGLPRIANDACLALAIHASSTSSQYIVGSISIIDG